MREGASESFGCTRSLESVEGCRYDSPLSGLSEHSRTIYCWMTVVYTY